MLTLYIGNKNYSSWSMRPWVLMKQAGIEFEEVMARFDSFDSGSAFKTRMNAVSPLGKVPVLVDDGFSVWDTLAIAEYLAEKFPALGLWPADPHARARARSVCAEMHSGFTGLRQHCSMNIEADLADMGRILWRDQQAVRSDVARLVAMWTELLDTHGGPMLMGRFGIVDAFYAPVVTRLLTYALPVPKDIAAYCEQVLALPGVKAWTDAARLEKDFIAFDEPYRSGR
jgi:glutathione S-transferase